MKPLIDLKRLAVQALVFSGLVLVPLAAAEAACTPKQLIGYARQGLTDDQIKAKCADKLPGWLAGQWSVYLKREKYDSKPLSGEDQSLNPFVKGMEEMQKLADAPPAERYELWIITIKDGKLVLNRLYAPDLNPGASAALPFSQPKAQASGHTVVGQSIANNRLKLTVVSPPYGPAGIEDWVFDLDLNSNHNQIVGSYKVKRDNMAKRMRYSQSGRIIMTRR